MYAVSGSPERGYNNTGNHSDNLSLRGKHNQVEQQDIIKEESWYDFGESLMLFLISILSI